MSDRLPILVTGGAGFIGSHVCKALAEAGYSPVTYDNFVYGHLWAVKWGPLEQGDLADRPRLDAVLQKYRPKAVLHFAAYAYVGESVQNPGKYYRNNVAGSLTLIESMRDCSIKNLIFSSSCSTYGMPQAIPITEAHPQAPINPYGASKLMIERMAADFGHAHGIRSVLLRYFNAAGADPDQDLGEEHDPETHLIPLAIQSALGKIPNLDIYGTDYPTPDGTAIRDYIHVRDLAVAHVQALTYLLDGGSNVALNLGTGRGYSVQEVVDAVGKIGKKPVPARRCGRREGDPPVLVADARQAADLLGWNPRYSDLDAIIETALNWYLK
jgi:UDP-arabinose 4-epimerase